MKKYNNTNFPNNIQNQSFPLEFKKPDNISLQESVFNNQPTQKKTKECGFINVTDPNLRKTIIEISKCPNDATNFTFWYNKTENNSWGLTIKSLSKNQVTEYEKAHGMVFSSQHTWKITWYNDNGILRVAQHSKSLAENLTGDDYTTIKKIYELYKSNK